MTLYYELSPAYGRDYSTAKAVEAAWQSGKDFIGDYQLGFKPINRQDIPKPCRVMLRYKRLTRTVVLEVKA